MSLVSYYSQIEPNLRRTASKGLISLLNKRQFEELAYNYFGDNNGNYTCPYTGEVISGKEIILEHIIPVYSNGGTVLFNCVPASKKINGSNEKGAKHLIDWWINSEYWDPNRLKRLVDYMLEGYELVFDEYTVDEVESSYLDIELDETEKLEDNLAIRETKEEEKELKKQARRNKIHSYSSFLLDCVSTLEKYNIDTQEITNKLCDLKKRGIFEDIEKYQLYQNKIQELIKNIIGDKNTTYLSYSINIDIKKLISSIDKEQPEEVLKEIEVRIKYIEQLLKDNGLSIIDYFKSLRDIVDIDILYKDVNSLPKEETNIFLENIKIGIDTKIKIFIEMLNKGNSKILKAGNKETLEGYQSIGVSKFWRNNKEKIKDKLEELKDNPEYEIARRIVDAYEIETSVDKKIPIFIEMLNQGNSEILRVRNQETLEGYPNIGLSQFWTSHKEKVKDKLEELKDNPKYDTARKLIDVFEMETSVDKKIPIFIDMLNKGNSEIMRQGNQEILEGYPSISLSHFWNSNKDKIKEKLFKELKDNLEYEPARQTILTYYKVNSYEELNERLEERGSKRKISNEISIEKKIQIFIEMLNQGNDKILKQRNEETLEGYPNIGLSQFWTSHKEKVKDKLEELKDNPKYDTARKLIDVFETENNLDKKISIFIEMLNKGNAKVLKFGNQETLEGYPSISLSGFWNSNKDKIKEKLFKELKDNLEYDVARQIVDVYEMETSVDKKILIFIDMLNKGNSEIMRQRNQETLEGYPSISLSHFWNNYKDKIKEKLFEELKDKLEYETARQTVLRYFKVNSLEELEEKVNFKKKQLKEVKEIKKKLTAEIISYDEFKKARMSEEIISLEEYKEEQTSIKKRA